MRARVRVCMVTDSGHREGVRGRRTGERTAGQQETGQDRNRRYRGQQEGRRTGQRETVTDREREDTEHGDMDSRTGTGSGSVRGQEDSRTGGLKRTSTVIVTK